MRTGTSSPPGRRITAGSGWIRCPSSVKSRPPRPSSSPATQTSPSTPTTPPSEHSMASSLWEMGATADATPQQVALAKQKLKAIALLQMTWIGAPTIYSGDEAGQTQTTYANTKVDPGDRRTFPWDHQDTALEDWYRLWID